MVAESLSKCNDPACDADEPNEKRDDESKTCAIAQKCVAACAAYGRVCPCFAKAAGRAACEALEKLVANSAVFKEKPDFVTFDSNDVVIKEKIGEGGFSNVNACVLKTGHEAGEELAVKYLKRQIMVDKHSFEHGASDLAIESRFLDALRHHEHIIKLHGVTAGSVETNLATGKEFGFFIIVDRLYDTLEHRIATWHEESEAMSGSLLSRFSSDLKEKKRRALLERLKLALDIADTMEYLHSRRIIYRDLKPDNVGFDKDGTLKLFDFGLARELKPSEARPDGRYLMTGNTGSR
jgi:serine/threonine protein kinase